MPEADRAVAIAGEEDEGAGGSTKGGAEGDGLGELENGAAVEVHEGDGSGE